MFHITYLVCKAVCGHLVRVTHHVSNYLTNQPSNSMEQTPSLETKSCSASRAFPPFYGIQRFTVMLTTGRLIHSMPSLPISLRSILMLFLTPTSRSFNWRLSYSPPPKKKHTLCLLHASPISTSLIS